MRQQLLKEKFPNTKSVIINFLKTQNTHELSLSDKKELVMYFQD